MENLTEPYKMTMLIDSHIAKKTSRRMYGGRWIRTTMISQAILQQRQTRGIPHALSLKIFRTVTM